MALADSQRFGADCKLVALEPGFLPVRLIRWRNTQATRLKRRVGRYPLCWLDAARFCRQGGFGLYECRFDNCIFRRIHDGSAD